MRNMVKASPATEMDATEFGLYVRQGGWRLGLLVARNVQRGKGTGNNQYKRGPVNRPDLKVSATEFARLAGLYDHKIVTRYLDAWDRYAAEDVVPTSSSLNPGSEVQLDEETLGAFRVTAPVSPQEVIDDDDDEDDELIEEDDVAEEDDEDIVEEPGDEQEPDDEGEDEEEVEEATWDGEEEEDEEDDGEVAYTTTSKPKSVTQNIKAEKAKQSKQSSSQHDAAAWHGLSMTAIAKLTVMEQSPGWWQYANNADLERLGNIIALATKLRKEVQKRCKATSKGQ